MSSTISDMLVARLSAPDRAGCELFWMLVLMRIPGEFSEAMRYGRLLY
jgi:hypothetical protein